MTVVYLSIGANMGDKLANLRRAIQRLDDHVDIKVIAVSKFYQTAPVGGVAQADFINAAVALETSLSPEVLLDNLHEIERQLHRVREIHWGPRTIDLDIIFYDDKTIRTRNLMIPHPEAFNRIFVLVPLLDILPTSSMYYTRAKTALKQLGSTQALAVYHGA